MDKEAVLELMREIGMTILDCLSYIGGKIVDGVVYLYIIFSDWLETVDIPIFTKTRILGSLRVSGTLFAVLIMYAVIINICAYHSFSADKRIAVRNGKKDKAAKREMRRSEARLMRVCFFGGALGGFLGMHIKHHKTNKKKFTVGVTVMLIIQLCIYSVAIGFLGFWLYFR